MERKYVELNIISIPHRVEFICTKCKEAVTIYYDEFLHTQSSDYWEDWNETECPKCEELIKIGNVEYD